MLESTPAFLRRNIRGRSPSEHLFHLFLAFLHDAGILDQPTPTPAAVHVALRNSLAFVDRLLVQRGSLVAEARAGRDQRPLLRGHRLRLPDSLPRRRGHLRLPGVPRPRRAQRRPQRNGRRIPHESLRAVVVEANPDVAARPGWRDVPDRSALDRRRRPRAQLSSL